MSEHSKENPLRPVKIDDYPKLFDYVLTKTGLIYYQKLKRNFILGRDLSIDDYNKLRLMQIYYATSNRMVQQVSEWQQICKDLDDRGIPEENIHKSKNQLITQKLIVKNPEYEPGLYRMHIQYIKENS